MAFLIGVGLAKNLEPAQVMSAHNRGLEMENKDFDSLMTKVRNHSAVEGCGAVNETWPDVESFLANEWKGASR